MKLYLIRHGEVSSNVEKIYNRKEDSLNATGIKQAEELREKIKNINYDAIISSPLSRAVETANIINYHNKKIILDERITEREHGYLEGRPLTLTDREEYWNYYSTIQYWDAETVQLLFNRVATFLDELKNKNYESVLIVAHSGVSKAFYAYFNGIEDGKFLNKGIKNCEIKEYDL